MYLRDKFKARYKEDCDYGEHLLVAMQNLEYLDKITMIPMVVYNYAPYPYPRQTMSGKNKGKEFDLMKQVMPEIQSVTQKMFPNNKYVAYLSGFYLITSIYMTARSLQMMGKKNEEVENVVKTYLNDDMVQELVEGIEEKTVLDSSLKEIFETSNTQAIMNDAVLSQSNETVGSIAGRVSMNLFLPSPGGSF